MPEETSHPRAAESEGALPPGYPAELVEQAWLVDGVQVLFRPVLPDDRGRYERMFTRLSPETLYRRFMTPVTRVDQRLLSHLVQM
ncbi:MAG TPA: hypothetical protein VNU01_13125, partial [Egibacteraceae bacterium]|nr:hypothetical protein [Egibacteraceae bacterium]